ncbi:MAG: phosphoenolpyruvate carboxykinase (ATP) [Candidatus Neomarinimicrobiota bacterium]
MYDLKQIGINTPGEVRRNWPVARLVEHELLHDGGRMGPRGAVMVDTGIYTGRSPNDRFIVDEPTTSDKIWWGAVNRKVDEKVFDHLLGKVLDYYNDDPKDRGVYLFDGRSGADPRHSINVRILAKKAWQAHFCNNMFIRPTPEELESQKPDFTIINASDVVDEDWERHGMNSSTFIIFHMARRLAIIGGSEYGGEMKKGIFSVMNYMLPLKGVMAMHCSANTDANGENPALFFGLSGTGKTTLSTDPNRPLIGDDEHGWSEHGIFNFEGGCYAKVINLDPEAEPDIYNAIRFGALLENVVYDPETLQVDYGDASKTENTRVSYPLNHIENSLYAGGKDSIGGHPGKIIFLSADAYGVLPPVSKLNPLQAMYHFISGYTAKVAGTERGITEPQATFSPCFGGPFLPLPPLTYAHLLREKIEAHGSQVYLVNTGWSGGTATSGAKRISIQATREIITSILTGAIEEVECQADPVFGTMVPVSLPGVDSGILRPKGTWTDGQAYDKTASMLAGKFQENFTKYAAEEAGLVQAGPQM